MSASVKRILEPVNVEACVNKEVFDKFGSKGVADEPQILSQNIGENPTDESVYVDTDAEQKTSSMDVGFRPTIAVNRSVSVSDIDTKCTHPARSCHRYVSESAVYPAGQYHNTRREVGEESFSGSQNFRRKRKKSFSRLHSYRSMQEDDSDTSQPVKSTLFSFTRKQKLTLLSLALMDFMSCTSLSVLAPFFPQEASKKGMRSTVQGFVFSIHALTVFIISPIFGKILPVAGAKFLFISGCFTCGVCNVLFGMLDQMTPGAMFTGFCFAIRIMEAIGAAAFCTASYTFVADVFPDNIGTVMGILETFVGLGFSLGPALGGALYTLGGYFLPFFVLGLSLIVSCPINIWLLPSAVRCDKNAQSGSILKLLKIPDVLAICPIIIMGSTMFGFLDPTLEPHLREQFDMNPAEVGLIFLIFAATYALLSPAWGWLADKTKRPWPIMLFGLVISSLGLLFIGPSPLLPFLPNTLWDVILGLVICGLFQGAALIPTMGAMLDACEPVLDSDASVDSIVAGVWSCMFFLGQVIGPSLGGVVLDLYGFPLLSTAVCEAALVIIFLLLLYLGVRRVCRFNSHESDETSPLIRHRDDNRIGDSSNEQITTYNGCATDRSADTGRGS